MILMSMLALAVGYLTMLLLQLAAHAVNARFNTGASLLIWLTSAFVAAYVLGVLPV